MYRYFLLIVCTLLLAGCPGCSFGQQADYRLFHNISLETEASVISCFLQDTQGMIWIGSNKGLFSYDGYAVQPHFVRGSRSNTRIHCGMVADSTYLYIGADNGLLIYNYRTDSYLCPDADFPTDIRAVAMYGGKLWLGTLNGLYTYQPVTGELAFAGEGLPHQAVYALLHASDGMLYVGTYNGCCRYRSDVRKFESIPLPVRHDRSNLFVNSLLEDRERGCIWMGTEGCLFRYVPATGGTSLIDAFRGNSVKSLALDGSGRLLAGTDNGLYIYQEGTELEHVVHDSRNLQSLSNNIVWTIFADRDQNVWLGTDYGISMSRYNRVLNHVHISQITGTGEGNQFYSMSRDSYGNFWFGGTNGLIRFSLPLAASEEARKRNATWYKMDDSRFPLSHNRVRQVYEDCDRQLWVATDGGVCRYDADRKRFITYNIVDSTRRYNANWAYSLFEDDRKHLWIATCLGGIFVVDKQRMIASGGGTYVAERTFSACEGLDGMFVNQMIADHNGDVWALHPNSMEKIDIRTGAITRIAPETLKSGQNPNYLLCDGEGYVWIGFPGGLMRVTPSDNSVRVLPFDAYAHYEVLCMVEAEEKIWVSTTEGLWMADCRTLELRRLNITDSRFTGMFYDRKDGHLYLGTADGFFVSTPERLLAEQAPSPLLLTVLYVNNHLWQPDTLSNMESTRYAERIVLKHRQNNLLFELSDLPYSQEEKSRLVYRLEGVGNREWNLLPPDANRITYNNLSYGDYRLLVSKLDAHGEPAGHPYSLDICILPPWYYTWWAKLLYGAGMLALVWAVVHFFRVKHRLRMEHLEKEKILEQSRVKMEFFTNLSHDLKMPLSMIIAPVSKMLPTLRNPQEKRQLEVVQRNAMKLNALIHQGLDFNRVDSGNNPLLIVSQIELVSFVRNLLSLYTEGKAGEKQLHFEFSPCREQIYIQMDAIKLESILDNLLSNAVKYTPTDGKVTITLEVSEVEKEVVLSVSDTGIGVSLCDQPYIFQRFFQSARTAGKREGTGIGLYLVKTYTELHGGSVQLTSEEGKGTTITLHLPVLDVSQPAQPSDEAASADAPLLLIVDDDSDVAEFIYSVLHAKYRCRLVSDGKQGLELAMELLPQLIISDVMMPVMDGFEMVRCLKKHLPTSTIPVILLTGKSDKETELESMRLDVDAFIAKPFEPDILLLRVEQLLHSIRSHETKARMELLTAPKEIEAVSHDEKFLSTVTRLIEEHISDSELNVNTLCEWTGTNNKQMYRKLKQLTGMSPVEYIKSIRMKKAAMLLRQQKFSVAEVMYMVGFSNHSYFSKCFQAAFGTTPKQYAG